MYILMNIKALGGHPDGEGPWADRAKRGGGVVSMGGMLGIISVGLNVLKFRKWCLMWRV